MNKTKLGMRIRDVRVNKANLSQDDFSKITGLDRTYISRLESGQKNPTVDTLSKICDGLGITLSELFNTDFNDTKTNSHFKLLSLFANIGVAEAYLEKTGFDVVVANEYIPRRAELYSRIYPFTKMICGDIKDINIQKDIIKASLETNVDIIMATPPCQGMSTAGQQNEDDERNLLIVPVISIINSLKPKYVFIENVPMFLNTKINVDGKQILIPDFINNSLSSNYIIKKYIINTKDYSVPQVRERTILLLSRNDMPVWMMPEKDKKLVTLRDAIGWIPEIDPFIKDVKIEKMLEIFPHYYEKEKTALAISQWNKPPKHPLRQIIAMQHTPTGCTAFDNKVYYPKKEDGTAVKGYHNTYKRQDWDKPAYTVTMDNVKISSQNNVHPGRFLGLDKNGDELYSDPRTLTLFEIMTIMSLPTDWPVPKNTSEAFLRRIIGEGIPPLFVKKVFENLLEVTKK